MIKDARSRSDEQRLMERRVLDWLEGQFDGVALETNPALPLGHRPGARIQPDFYSESGKIIGEVFAHMGPIKKGQHDKLAADVLKLALFERDRGIEFEKYIVVCDARARDLLLGNSYLAAAIEQFGVKVMLYTPSGEEAALVTEAQRRQDFYPGHAEPYETGEEPC